jgi:anti-sigma B factor antagonist
VDKDEPGLSLQRLQVGHRIVLAVGGEIDLATAPALRAGIADAWEKGAQDLWIDLTDVTFIDSTGVHALIDARGRAIELDRRLAVICPPGPARHTLELTGIDGSLAVFASRAEAHRGG